jgi:hypothetical protein
LIGTRFIISIAVALLTAATIVRLAARGGPYFQIPQTVMDHVDRVDAPYVVNPTRTPLAVIPKLARFIPRGAEVTCFRPSFGHAQYDAPSFLAAIGQLPRNRVLPPFAVAPETPVGQLTEYVIAIDEPFQHPAYHLVAQVPHGRLYKVGR